MSVQQVSGKAAGSRAFAEVEPREVHAWLQNREAVLIDVREPDEHARERIPGSRLLPLSRFDPGQAEAGVAPGTRLVFHCRAGSRSADAARLSASLGEAGRPVFSMRGGIEAWKKEGLPVELNERVSGVSVMRQVQLIIGACVLVGAALAWLVHPAFLAVPAFFGAGLVFAGATGTCGLAAVVARMPWNRGPKC